MGEATAGPSPTRPPFTETLAAVVAAYPEAGVEMDEKGVVLHPSRPPSHGWPPVPFWQAESLREVQDLPGSVLRMVMEVPPEGEDPAKDPFNGTH